MTVIDNTVGSLYLYRTEEEPGVGRLSSFLAHFLHTCAISWEWSQCLFQGAADVSVLSAEVTW